MNPVAPAPVGPTVGDVAVGLRSLWLPVLVFVAVMAGAGYAIGSAAEVTYEAATSVLVAEARDQVGVFGEQVPGPAVDTETAVLLARSDAVRLRAAEKVQVPLDEVDDIDVDAEDDERTLILRAVADTPTEAIDLANAHADALVEEREAQVRDELARIVEALRERVSARDADLVQLRARTAEATAAADPGDPAVAALQGELEAASAAAEVLRERLVQLEVEAEVASAGVVVADEAAEAGEVGSPGPTQLAILGALVGLVLAAGVVYLRLSYLVAAEEGRSRVQPRVGALRGDRPAVRDEAS